MEADKYSAQQAWAEYWGTGQLHSLPGTYAGNYGGETLRFWIGIFDRLRPNARILDIGTGNGALVKLLLEHSNSHDTQIDAIDAATIAPSWLSSVSISTSTAVRFHSHTRAEMLPFADSSFDLVISQYGIEYSDWPQSLPAALRVLKPDAALAFVVHHRDSLLLRTAREEREHLQWLLHDSDLLAAAATLVEPMFKASRGAGIQGSDFDWNRAERTRQRFNAILDRLAKRATQASGSTLLRQCGTLVVETLQLAQRDPRQAGQRLNRIMRSLRSGYARNTDLLAHAPDDAAIKQLLDTVAELRPHWKVTAAELREGRHLLGRTIVAGHPSLYCS